MSVLALDTSVLTHTGTAVRRPGDGQVSTPPGDPPAASCPTPGPGSTHRCSTVAVAVRDVLATAPGPTPRLRVAGSPAARRAARAWPGGRRFEPGRGRAGA